MNIDYRPLLTTEAFIANNRSFVTEKMFACGSARLFYYAIKPKILLLNVSLWSFDARVYGHNDGD